MAAWWVLITGVRVVHPPAVFRGQQGAAEQAWIADVPWWELFKDETLRDLIKTALANNNDLRIAVSRVEQARQIAAGARRISAASRISGRDQCRKE